MKPFWVVWNGDKHATPVAKHNSLPKARDEAARLAKANPGTTFIVLESVEACTAGNLTWEKHGDDDPFA